MRAITLWQPWATLIAYGYKTIETRSWETRYRGPIAIHAAKKFDRSLYATALSEPFQTCLAEIGYANPSSLPLGCIVAKADLIRVVPTQKLTVSWVNQHGAQFEEEFGDYSLGRFGWILDNIKRLKEPLEAKGQQRLWDWPEPYFPPNDPGWIDVFARGDEKEAIFSMTAGEALKRLKELEDNGA